MRHINTILGAVFLTLLLTLSLQAAETTDTKRLFITLTSGDFKPSGMGIAIANAMQDAGVQTTVLVGANALNLTLKRAKQAAFSPTGSSVRDMMVSLVKKGGHVMLCGMCAADAEVTQSDVAPGIQIVKASDVYGALFAPNTSTLSF